MPVQLLVQLAACGLLFSFSPGIYLWLRGFTWSGDENDLPLILSRLTERDIENMKRLGGLGKLGSMLFFLSLLALLAKV